MDALDGFTNWFQGIKEELEYVSKFMSESISDNPAQLIQELSHVEAWYARATTWLAESNSWLDRLSNFYLKDSGTSLEREIHLKDAVADIRKVRNIVEGLVDAMKQRIILGESVLRFQSAQFNIKPITEKVF